ncbi:Putative adhesin [Natronoarchaeum philippinense]|uniref:Putative adhesin n=1 Tax=Natronoarchaeum philippinense TaxID=558529 RepID=A0A285P2R7_NATPI|nr:DUF4097 family beta strand repeat-containing protein [Natronoarchaeum philippinense]SNZ15557.1 Putative adhesin [Natronoarchaeum philippinense]
MTATTPRRGFLAGIAAIGLGALGGCISLGERQQTEETHTFDVSDSSELTVENGVGDVTVSAEERSDVRVRAVKHAGSEDQFDAITLNDERAGETLSLTVDNEIDSVLVGSPPSMTLDIAVPADLRVARVDTATGDVGVSDTGGDIAIETATGDVDITETAAGVSIDTNTGDIVVSGAGGPVRTSTDTGDVQVRRGWIDDIQTTTGDVDVEVAALDGDADMGTDTGDVDAALSASLDARVAVETDTGDVSASGLDFSDLESAEHSLEGTLGEGTDRLSIETTTGDVTLTGTE